MWSDTETDNTGFAPSRGAAQLPTVVDALDFAA